MKKSLVFLGLVIGLFAASGAMAAPFTAAVANDNYAIAQGGVPNGIPTANDSNDGTPDQFEAVNKVLGTAYTHNYELDGRFVEPDYAWESLLNPSPIVLIGLTAANSNTLGFYSDVGSGNVKTSLLGPVSGFGFTGSGTLLDPFTGVLATLPATNPFGWYLNSSGTNYFSEPALNSSGFDHMMSFSLPELDGETFYINDGSGAQPVTFTVNSYLLAWEDLPLTSGKLGDEDYDDMMYLVARVQPVPEPATMFMLGAGLLGMAVLRRKFRK